MKILKTLKNPNVVGWLLWAIITLGLAYPCVLLMYWITYDTANTMTRVLTGIFFAAIFAGVLTTLGNEVWFRMKRRQATKRKKDNRKEKRRPGGR